VGQLSSFLEDIAARGFRPRHILDVGANRGRFSRDVRRVFPDAGFTLVEPQLEMKEPLEAFCAETPGARWIQAAAGAAPGQLAFSVLPDTVSSSFLKSAAEAESLGGETRTVPVVTLDSLFDGMPLPELVKLDVEGFELEVLRGAPRVLAAAELVLAEVSLYRFHPGHPTMIDILAHMADHGFRPYDFTWFLRRPSDGALGLADIAFARDGGVLRASQEW
jgi:FkbM family methyltransferase